MPFFMNALLIGLAAMAALFSILLFLKLSSASEWSLDKLTLLLRSESERIRLFQETQARNLRQELTDNLRGFQETTLKAFQGLGDSLHVQMKDFGARLEGGISSVEAKLESASDKQKLTLKELKEEMTLSFRRFAADMMVILEQNHLSQKEKLEQVTHVLGLFSEKQERAQEMLKQAVEDRLEKLRVENAQKLDEMRKTVDEKLQDTLQKRLGDSFKQVSDNLEQVFKSMGEMQTLATGVGDLKKVLSNIKSRGTWGEISLGNLLEQVMTSEQYGVNVEIKPNSGKRVEFAIKLPGGEEGHPQPLWLPIDAKFPLEDYDRLVDASERGNLQEIEMASKALETCIRNGAKDISQKYIHPPYSTDFAVMFLPTEGLFAEVIRHPGLADSLQREYRILVAGPTNLTALLNSLRMGFRTLAIQKRSSEVWKVLALVKSEFSKFGAVVHKIQKKLDEAQHVVQDMGVRQRAVDRSLRNVETLNDTDLALLLDDTSPQESKLEPLSKEARVECA